mgnify:CR=1 FL=1
MKSSQLNLVKKNKGIQYDRFEYGPCLSFSDLLAMLRVRYVVVFDKVAHKYDSGNYLGEVDIVRFKDVYGRS